MTEITTNRTLKAMIASTAVGIAASLAVVVTYLAAIAEEVGYVTTHSHAAMVLLALTLLVAPAVIYSWQVLSWLANRTKEKLKSEVQA